MVINDHRPCRQSGAGRLLHNKVGYVQCLCMSMSIYWRDILNDRRMLKDLHDSRDPVSTVEIAEVLA